MLNHRLTRQVEFSSLFIYLFCQCFQVTAGIHRLILCEMGCALIYIKWERILGRENEKNKQRLTAQKTFQEM